MLISKATNFITTQTNKRTIIFGVFLSVWIYLQLQIKIPDDGAWLMLASQKLLHGMTATQSYFDNNPPLSYMIYIPAIWLSNLFHIPIWDGYNIYTIMFLLCCLFFFRHLSHPIKQNSYALYDAFFLGYVIAILLIPFSEFGQKDHFIAMALPPFILAQWAIGQKHTYNKAILHSTFLLCVPFVLLKPHFGLLPFMMILHRLYKTKSIHSLIKADVLYLVFSTIIYISISFLWFSDYIETILPLAIPLYALTSTQPIILTCLVIALLSSLLALCSYSTHCAKHVKSLGLIFSSMVILSTIATFIQGKGFSGHFLPALSFLIPSLSLCLLYGMNTKVIYFLNSALILLLCGIILSSDRYTYLQKDVFLASDFSQFIKEESVESPIFIESSTTNIIASTSLYHNIHIASRFPSMWFAPALLNHEHTSKPLIFERYLLEDLNQYKPSILLLFREQDTPSSLINIYKGMKLTQYIDDHYTKSDTVSFSIGHMMFVPTPDIYFDVYKRRDN